MLDEDQHIDMYFEELLANVKEDKIVSAWMEIIDKLDISPELIALRKPNFCSDNYLYAMKTPAWVQKMKRMMGNIRRLERRIFFDADNTM